MALAYAWLLTIYHTSTYRVATRDVPVEGQTDHANVLTNIGGVPFEGRIMNTISVSEELGRFGAGVIIPRATPVELDNRDATFAVAPATPWHQTKVRLQRLNGILATVTEEFTGIITDAIFGVGTVTFTLGSLDEIALQRPIPRVIVTPNTFEDSAIDVGKAVPVVFGANAIVRPVHVATTPGTTDGDGEDYIVSHVGSGTTVNALFSNLDKDGTTPLERWPTDSYATSSTDYFGYRSIRLFQNDEDNSLIVQASRPGSLFTTGLLDNPANVIGQILSDSTWGLGETIRTAAGLGSFDDAVTDFADADLDDCISGALADEGNQARAIDILNELCELRGCRLSKRMQSDNSLKWELRVDQEPAAATVTLGHNDGVFNNLLNVVSYRTLPPLGEMVQQILFRYSTRLRGPGRRGATNLYEYEIARTVHSIGTDLVKTTRWVRVFQKADRILYYWTTMLAAAGEQLVVDADPDSIALAVGDLVNVTVANPAISKVMRVGAKQAWLERTRLVLWGYDAAAYTFPGYQTAPTAAAPTTDLRKRGSGANLVPNPEFSQRYHPVDVDDYDFPIAHLWGSQPVGGASPASFIVTGGVALSIGGTTVEIACGIALGSDWRIVTKPFPIPAASDAYILSVYASTVTDLNMTVDWYTSASAFISTSTATVIEDPNDTNPAGYSRCFVRVRSPATAVYAVIALINTNATNGTIIFDAVQFELVSRRNFPTQWRSFQPWNAPNQINSVVKDVTTGASTDQVLESELIDLTGLNVASRDTTRDILRFGTEAYVTISIEQSLTGPTSIDIGHPNNLTAFGDNVSPVTAGKRTTLADIKVLNPIRFLADTKVRITFNGGNATAGKIRVIVHAKRLMAA